MAAVIHEIPLERRTLHGHFSPDLEPVLAIDSGDTIAFACPNAGWWPPRTNASNHATPSSTVATLSSALSRCTVPAGETLEVRV